MKKIILKLILGFIICVLFSGCFAFHSGYMTSSACLSSANFSYVKHDIKGVSTATYWNQFGGMKKETLVGLAKQNMLINNPLQDNQALVNITVNFKKSFNLIFEVIKVRCIITADVVEFKK